MAELLLALMCCCFHSSSSPTSKVGKLMPSKYSLSTSDLWHNLLSSPPPSSLLPLLCPSCALCAPIPSSSCNAQPDSNIWWLLEQNFSPTNSPKSLSQVSTPQVEKNLHNRPAVQKMEESNPSSSWKGIFVTSDAFEALFPQYLAAAGSVEPAELFGLGWVIVARVLLDVLKLKQLDIRVQKYVTEGVGPDNLQLFHLIFPMRCCYRESLH